jgi:hypothetical protein
VHRAAVCDRDELVNLMDGGDVTWVTVRVMAVVSVSAWLSLGTDCLAACVCRHSTEHRAQSALSAMLAGAFAAAKARAPVLPADTAGAAPTAAGRLELDPPAGRIELGGPAKRRRGRKMCVPGTLPDLCSGERPCKIRHTHTV